MNSLRDLIPATVPGLIPPFSFVAPDGLHELPVSASHEERKELAARFVRELYSQGSESLWEQAAPYFSAIGEFLASEGLTYSAIGLFSTDQGGVAQCALTVAIVETDQTSAEVAAEGIAASLSQNPTNDIHRITLPCGSAVSCVALTEISPTTEESVIREEEKILMGNIQIHIPFPTGPFTAILTLETVSMEHWDEFSNMMVAILQTVSFEEEG